MDVNTASQQQLLAIRRRTMLLIVLFSFGTVIFGILAFVRFVNGDRFVFAIIYIFVALLCFCFVGLLIRRLRVTPVVTGHVIAAGHQNVTPGVFAAGPPNQTVSVMVNPYSGGGAYPSNQVNVSHFHPVAYPVAPYPPAQNAAGLASGTNAPRAMPPPFSPYADQPAKNAPSYPPYPNPPMQAAFPDSQQPPSYEETMQTSASNAPYPANT